MGFKQVRAPIIEKDRKTVAKPLETVRVYDALLVRNALEHGFMYISNGTGREDGFIPSEYFKVGLREGVTEKRLIEFIGSKRPCDDMAALRQAETAGLITMRGIGKIPFIPRDPQGRF
jgi:hypothetical protein